MGRARRTNGREGERLQVIGGNTEGKRPLGKPRRRWVDNVKMDLGEIAWGGVVSISVTQEREKWRALVNTVMFLRVQ
jgi:hypothetical protein